MVSLRYLPFLRLAFARSAAANHRVRWQRTAKNLVAETAAAWKRAGRPAYRLPPPPAVSFRPERTTNNGWGKYVGRDP